MVIGVPIPKTYLQCKILNRFKRVNLVLSSAHPSSPLFSSPFFSLLSSFLCSPLLSSLNLYHNYSPLSIPLLNFLSSPFPLPLTSFFPNLLLSPIFFLPRVVLVRLGLLESLDYQEPMHLQAYKVSLVLMEVMETRDTPETEEFQDHR